MDFVFLNFNSRTFPTSSSRHVPAVSDFNRFLFCSQFPVTIKKAKESRGCEKKEQVFRKLEAAEEVSIGIAAVLTRLDGIFALKDQQTKKKKALRPFFCFFSAEKKCLCFALDWLEREFCHAAASQKATGVGVCLSVGSFSRFPNALPGLFCQVGEWN